MIPESLVRWEVAHDHLTELRVVGSMHERKALMAELSDAVIALPGGFGTFEELFETITWSQLGIHRKPIGVLNVGGFYDGLLALVEHAIEEGFVPAQRPRADPARRRAGRLAGPDRQLRAAGAHPQVAPAEPDVRGGPRPWR